MERPPGTAGGRYLEQFSDTDLRLLGTASGLTPGWPTSEAADYLRARPDLIEPALFNPTTFERLFAVPDPDPGDGSGGGGGGEPPAEIERDAIRAEMSPFLLFAVAVHRGVVDLQSTPFVAERFGAHKRIPVFDTATLRDYYLDPTRRLFAVEHLASYTRVQSGPVWVRQGERWRRQRFSELEPQRLAGLVDLVAEEERPGIYRRLGDLALFLTGVFPDAAATKPMHPIESERLVRTLATTGGSPLSPAELTSLANGAGSRDALLRVLGPRWYRVAADLAPLPPVKRMLRDAADGFDVARRFLNHLTDRYLFPLKDGWFGAMAS